MAVQHPPDNLNFTLKHIESLAFRERPKVFRVIEAMDGDVRRAVARFVFPMSGLKVQVGQFLGIGVSWLFVAHFHTTNISRVS
jgi:hypothetical protein